MKLFINLCGIALAGFLGYSLEPNLRLQLTGMKPGRVEIAQNGKILLQLGEGKEQIDLESLTPNQLPEKVEIRSEVVVSDPGSGITMKIQAGNRVKLLRIEGANAIVSPGEGSYSGKIPVMDTDLVAQLSKNPPSLTPAPEPAPVPPVTTPGGDSAEPPVTPEPPPVPEPAPVPVPTPEPTPEPAPTPVPVPEPAPMPEPPVAAPPVTATNAGSADVVEVMKASVKSGQIAEFKFDQVLEWKAGESEAVDGVSFQTGTALYKAVTFLGEKTIEAKAFIKDGAVQRWIWPRSGMEIK